MRNAAVALSALSAGEAQFYSGSANGSALGAMAGGLDLVFVAGLANQLNGTMVVAPAIQSPADLKGQNIGIQSIGGRRGIENPPGTLHLGTGPEPGSGNTAPTRGT